MEELFGFVEKELELLKKVQKHVLQKISEAFEILKLLKDSFKAFRYFKEF